MIELILILELLTSFDNICFENSTKQMFDTSCGFSSISTVMKNWYDDDICESDLILEAFSDNQDDNFSVSMNVLSTILSNHDYYSKGYKMTYEELVDAVKKYPPVLVHYKIGEGHFVLVLSIDKEKVIVSDPAEGVRTIFKNDFEKKWSQNVMLIGHKNKNVSIKKIQTVVENTQSRFDFLEFVGRI